MMALQGECSAKKARDAREAVDLHCDVQNDQRAPDEIGSERVEDKVVIELRGVQT